MLMGHPLHSESTDARESFAGRLHMADDRVSIGQLESQGEQSVPDPPAEGDIFCRASAICDSPGELRSWPGNRTWNV